MIEEVSNKNNRFRTLPDIIEPRYSLIEQLDKAAENGIVICHSTCRERPLVVPAFVSNLTCNKLRNYQI